jgi:hypothetical protein
MTERYAHLSPNKFKEPMEVFVKSLKNNDGKDGKVSIGCIQIDPDIIFSE